MHREEGESANQFWYYFICIWELYSSLQGEYVFEFMLYFLFPFYLWCWSFIYFYSTSGSKASLVAQTVKHLPTMWETRVRSLGQEDPLEKEMATHTSTLAWKIPWMEEPDRLQSMGSQRVRHDWATSLTHSEVLRKFLFQHQNIKIQL